MFIPSPWEEDTSAFWGLAEWTFIPELDASPHPSRTAILAYERYASKAVQTYYLQNYRHQENGLISPYEFKHMPDYYWQSLWAAVEGPPDTSPLLRIPAEIRERIYSFLFVSDSSVKLLGSDILQLTKRNSENEIVKFEVRHGDLLRPLQINCKLFNEMMPYFYKENTFESEGYFVLERFLKGIGSRRRKCIRSMIVSDQMHSSRQNWKGAKAAYDLLSESCYLQKLHIRVREVRRSRGFPITVDLSRKMLKLCSLKKLRGLKDVSIEAIHPDKGYRDGQPISELLESNRNKAFAEGLINLLKTPKTLLEEEEARNVPAKKRTLKAVAQLKRTTRSASGIMGRIQKVRMARTPRDL